MFIYKVLQNKGFICFFIVKPKMGLLMSIRLLAGFKVKTEIHDVFVQDFSCK